MKRLSIVWLLVCALVGLELLSPSAALAVYYIEYGDAITVSVLGHPEYGAISPIRPDGVVSIPFLGDVEVVGQTPEQIAERLRRVLAGNIHNPQVSVMVVGFRARTITMLGQLGRTGPMTMPGPHFTLYEAIAQANFTPRSVKDQVYVIRGDGPTAKRFVVNVDEMIRTGDFSNDMVLQPGDKVQVNEVWYPDVSAALGNLSLAISVITTIGVIFAIYDQASRPRTTP